MNKIVLVFLILAIMFKQIIFADTKDETNNNTYINTSNVSYDEKNNIVELFENSKINTDDTNILIDRGIIDYNKDEIEVFGNFYLYQELNILSGKDLKGDTKLTNFKATDVSYIYNNDLKIDSDIAERSENFVYFYNNFLTPCELEGFFNCPTWSLRIDKTKYEVEKDKFVHFDTFLQIADYKIFYLPYLSHYGSKAPRQKGFLTPSIEFTIGGNTNTAINTPYYYPVNESLDVTLTPKFYLDSEFRFLESYYLHTLVSKKTSGGHITLDVENIKNENNDNINSSLKLNLREVLNKNTILTANGLFTNSISTTRSTNREPITFEEIYLKLQNYNLLRKNDYLKSELATVESFDMSDDNEIPISPSFFYHSQFFITDSISLLTNIDSRVISRESSSQNNPSENNLVNFNNFIITNNKINNINLYNKISFINSINDYKFQHDASLDKQEENSFLILSSDLHFNSDKFYTPRIKIIHHQDINNLKKTINEDSNSISFNYNNQFSDNRFYGNDLADNTSRVVYGIENELELSDFKFQINLNQSYDLKAVNNYTKKINQTDNISDYSLEIMANHKFFILKSNFRIDNKDYTNKEMNYSLQLDKPFDLNLKYNETNKDAFETLSTDTKSLGLQALKEINNNLSLAYESNMDLKNNYRPFSESLTLSLYDECSKLEIVYTNRRFNDNYNTTPEERIGITFSMDYLGFFGYEQSTDLLTQEPGNFTYGL